MVKTEKSRRFLLGWTIIVGFVLLLCSFRLLLQRDFNYHLRSHIGSRSSILNAGRESSVSQLSAEASRSLFNINPAHAESAKFDLNYVETNLNSLDQTDPQLIQYARVRYLTPPSKLPYHFEGLGSFRREHGKWVTEFFGNKRNGTFIEAGANEGARNSHTLHLEKELGWSGLLVECNPTVIPHLKTRHRKAWVAGVCLAPTTTPGILNFSNPTKWSYSGRLGEPWKLKVGNDLTPWTFFDVETLPLYTILAAIGLTEVDFFLFDVEGSELSILKTVPFDKVIFRVLIVEIYFYTEEEKEELNTLLVSNGYHFVTDIDIDKGF